MLVKSYWIVVESNKLLSVPFEGMSGGIHSLCNLFTHIGNY